MNLLEIADLAELLRRRLNIPAPQPGAFMGGAALAHAACMHACAGHCPMLHAHIQLANWSRALRRTPC